MVGTDSLTKYSCTRKTSQKCNLITPILSCAKDCELPRDIKHLHQAPVLTMSLATSLIAVILPRASTSSIRNCGTAGLRQSQTLLAQQPAEVLPVAARVTAFINISLSFSTHLHAEPRQQSPG